MSTHRGLKLDHNYHHAQSHNLSVKPETLTLLGENIVSILKEIYEEKDFLSRTQSAQELKPNNWQVGS